MAKHLNILVLGSVHGNEPLGGFVGELLQAQPILGVEYITANPKALAEGRRYIDENLAFAFRHTQADTYETQRAQEILQKVKMLDPDVILDIHSNNFGLRYVATGREVTIRAALLAEQLTGFHEYRSFFSTNMLHDYFLQTIALEFHVANKSAARSLAKKIYRGLKDIATSPSVTAGFPPRPRLFYRIHEITIQSHEVAQSIRLLESFDFQRGEVITGEAERILRQYWPSVDRQARLVASTWGYRNMSPLAPSLGMTANGVRRRICFGVFLEERPVVLDQDVLRFL